MTMDGESGGGAEATICFIPARGGSKRIPRKNLRKLAGRPLLSYSVETALNADVFDRVVVSSADREILDLAEDLGAVPDPRPPELTGDAVRFVEVVEEFLRREEHVGRFGHIGSMLPTCPFRSVDDVREAVDIYRDHDGRRFLVTVTKYEFPPQLALRFEQSNRLAMMDPDAYCRTTRSQDIPTAYHPNGALYLAPVDDYLEEGTFFAEPLLGYSMPAERSFDIDYPYQLQIADWMMRSQDGEGEMSGQTSEKRS